MNLETLDFKQSYLDFIDFMETHSSTLKAHKLLSDAEIADGSHRDGIIDFTATTDEITLIWLRENDIQKIILPNNTKITHLLSIFHSIVTGNLITHQHLISKYFHKNEIGKIFKQASEGKIAIAQKEQVFLDLLDSIEIWALHHKMDPINNDILFDNNTDSRLTVVFEKSRDTGNIVGKFVLDNKKSKNCLKNLHKIQQLQIEVHKLSHRLHELYTFSFDENDIKENSAEGEIDRIVEEISLLNIEITEYFDDIKTNKKHSIFQSVKKSFKKMMAKKNNNITAV